MMMSVWTRAVSVQYPRYRQLAERQQRPPRSCRISRRAACSNLLTALSSWMRAICFMGDHRWSPYSPMPARSGDPLLLGFAGSPGGTRQILSTAARSPTRFRRHRQPSPGAPPCSGRDDGVGEEHLVELRHTGDLTERPDLDAGLAHRQHENWFPCVWAHPVGAGDQQPVVGGAKTSIAPSGRC